MAAYSDSADTRRAVDAPFAAAERRREELSGFLDVRVLWVDVDARGNDVAAVSASDLDKMIASFGPPSTVRVTPDARVLLTWHMPDAKPEAFSAVVELHADQPGGVTIDLGVK